MSAGYAGDPTFERAVESFNCGDFFDAHEEWERLWTPKSAPARPYLQALIHFAVACHHHRNGNRNGYDRQLAKGLRKIEPYLPTRDGLDLGRLAAEMSDLDDGYPRIRRR